MISRILMNIMMMQSIFARVSVEDIKTVSETLHGKKQDVIINPAGPLNLLRGYIGQRNGYMHNKRFYSPEIDINYSMKEKVASSADEQEYDFTRIPVNDEFYKDLDTSSASGKYLSAYYTQLIKMFPSADGNLSIEAGRPNALTNFLRADHVKEDAKYILASLLLLSEGIDIKIAVDHAGKKNKLIIKSKTCKEKEFVNVEMHMPGIDPVTKEYKEDIYQSETTGIIKFYMQCRDNLLLKKGGEFAMPTTKEEFESGKFLNNPGFLIQTYIYEFIDTVESYIDFVNAVHELLVDQITEKSNPDNDTKKKGKKDRIFNDFFLPKDAHGESIKYIASFCDLIQTTNADAKFPFYNSSQLPQYTRVPRCKLDKSGFEENQALYYSNCVEATLLGIFCCLAYNPDTGKYQTSHMGEEISKECREFFKKYSMPTETTDFEMHRDWSKVVACLNNDEIDYKQERNELRSGIANIFLAISEITGQKADILELVQYIESACKTRKLDSDEKDYIENKIQSIIRSLSQNDDVVVNCKKMRLEVRSNGKPDLFSEISICYTSDDAENGISLDVEKGHASLTLLKLSQSNSEDIQNSYEGVGNVYSDMKGYTGWIVAHYIEMELNALRLSAYEVSSNFEEKVTEIIKNGSENICKIFLLGKLIDIKHKAHIMESFLIYTIENDVGKENPLTRWTSNILGSVSLNDPATLFKLIRFFFFHSRWKEYYPKLAYNISNFTDRNIINSLDISYIYRLILKYDSITLAVKALCNYLELTMDNRNIHYALLHFSEVRKVFIHMMYKNKISYLADIHSTLEATKHKKDLNVLNSIYIPWFISACEHNDRCTPEFFRMAYSFINFDILNTKDNFKSGLYDEVMLDAIIYVLKVKRSVLCSEDDYKSVNNYNRLLAYFISSISSRD
ncbi:hypothetical protein NEAUS04_1103 [Nematocida ausubeli]|nr:hypothetical protein NEAUS04_1103 [Nematocida ausubeli]